jgi:hypothetical protein
VRSGSHPSYFLSHTQGKEPRCPLHMRLGGPQSRSGRCREEKKSLVVWGIKPQFTSRLTHSLVIILTKCFPFVKNRYSEWLRGGGSRGRSSSPGRGKIFLLSTSSRPALGVYSASYPMGIGGFFPGVKRPGDAARNLYTFTPPLSLHGVVLN